MRGAHNLRCARSPQLVSAVVVIGQLALTMFAYEHGDVVPNSARTSCSSVSLPHKLLARRDALPLLCGSSLHRLRRAFGIFGQSLVCLERA